VVVELFFARDGFAIVSGAVLACWEIAQGSTWLAVGFGVLAAVLSAWIDAKWFGGVPLKRAFKQFWKGIAKPAVLGPVSLSLVVFLVHLMVIVPSKVRDDAAKKHNEENEQILKRTKESMQRQEAKHTAKLVESERTRTNIYTLENVDTKRLGEAEEKLQRAENRIRTLDPMLQPIASLTATVRLSFTNAEYKGDFIKRGTGIALAKGSRVLAHAFNIDHLFWKSIYTMQFQFPTHDTPMGKPMSILASADNIELIFKKGGIPTNTWLVKGQITFILNGQIPLQFDIPAQHLNHQPDENPLVTVQDLANGFAPITQHPGINPGNVK